MCVVVQIPRELHKETPVFLLATAGLRRLGHAATPVLAAVRKTLWASPFR